jgi:hypothetical protein
MDSNDLKPTVGDHLHTLVRAGLSTIPIVGGPVLEVFNSVIIPPLSKRRDKWLLAVSEDIKNLEKTINDFKLDQLVNNEVFVTTFLHATQIALRTHKQDKINSLRNAVIKSASIPDDHLDKAAFYLNMVDAFTSLHIQVLYLLCDRKHWLEQHNKPVIVMKTGSVWELLDYAFRPLPTDNRELFVKVLKDLHTQGLTVYDLSDDASTINSIQFATTTDLAKDFISFIVRPISI